MGNQRVETLAAYTCVYTAVDKGRGGFGFRQNRGGVTRILMVSQRTEYHVFTTVLR
ncbi:MAG: hypothetical protein RMY29_014090 [Nostoc sp. CreGUA01]|nr:hypothetical protein [Nostoc sp. CreGUA01]